MINFVRRHFMLLRVITVVTVLLVLFFFSLKKQGFYIDEYYLYTFANGTQQGIDIRTGEWNDTSGYLSQLISEGDENFHFRQVYQIESEQGVHPPLYYYLLHFVSSVFTGVFSKWIGLSINLILMIPIMILVCKLAWKLSSENECVTLITMLLYGLSPATISMVVLVRMYLLLSLWTLFYAYIHVADLEREKLSVGRFLFPVLLCGFFGFLTQYFFVVIMFFITFTYAFYLLFFSRRVKDAFIYGATAATSLVCTYFVWPVSVFHIFKGYRGKGAVSQLKDISHFWERLLLHLQYLNKMVFGGVLMFFVPLLLIGVFLIVRRIVQLRKEHTPYIVRSLSVSTKGIILLGIASLLNFIALSQIALMDGGITCCRQLYTAYALFLLLIPCGLAKLIMYISRGRSYATICSVTLMVTALLVLGHVQQNVLFLYEDEIVAITYAKNHPDAKVVMFQKDDGMYDSRIQELMLYPKVYFASVDDLSTAKDAVIADADELLVYLPSDTKKQEECFQSILQQNPKITKKDYLWNSDFFSVYLLH